MAAANSTYNANDVSLDSKVQEVRERVCGNLVNMAELESATLKFVSIIMGGNPDVIDPLGTAKLFVNQMNGEREKYSFLGEDGLVTTIARYVRKELSQRGYGRYEKGNLEVYVRPPRIEGIEEDLEMQDRIVEFRRKLRNERFDSFGFYR